MPRLLRMILTLTAIAAGTQLHPATLTTFSGPSQAEAMHAPIEGFGAGAAGGTGKPECVVRSLADSGPGTLRDCLSAPNRYIRFAVGGTIQLKDKLFVPSFVTIDGFSAPAPGITLRDDTLTLWDTTNVIIRNIRLRDIGFTGEIGQTGTVWGKRDCIDIQGASRNIVIDHVSVYNCGDGGIDIKIPARDITIQYTIISAWKTALWGGTDTTVGQENVGRISFHHGAIVCNDRGSGEHGCDRNPLIRAQGQAPVIDLRYNIIDGWYAANGVKIETAAQVNVVGNAFLPRAESSVANRQESIHFDTGARVHTARNVEYPVSGTPVNMNAQGNTATPFAAPAITERPRGCVVKEAGASPRDAVDHALIAFLSEVPTACTTVASSPIPPSSPAPATSSPSQPDLVPRLLSAPNTATPGQTLSITTTIANVGTATAANSSARLVLSTGQTISSGDIVLAALAIPSLASNGTHTQTTNTTLPSTMASGTYTVFIQADDGRVIAESNEANNVIGIPLSLVSPPAAAPPAAPAPAQGSTPAPASTTAATPITVLINAESMTLKSGMRIRSDRGALGGRYITTAGGSNSTAPVPEASLSVTVPASGTYYLWARMYGPSPAEDALYLGIDSSWARVYPSVAGAYQWVRVATSNGSGSFGFQLGAGRHTISVGRGELNARLDAVYLTNNESYVPTLAPDPRTARRRQ